MTFSRLPVEQRKTERLTVVMSPETKERLGRAAAYVGMTKSECAHDLICNALKDMPSVGDEEIVEAEKRQDEWRDKYGLR